MPQEHVTDVTDASFQRDVIEKSAKTPVVVDFWAPWCGPCRVLGPVLEKLALEGGGAWLLARVNTDENQELARTFQISGIPAVMGFRNGKVVSRFVGAQPESRIREFLKQLVPSEVENLAAEGEKRRKAGRFEEAEAAFSKALEKDRGAQAARLGLARLRVDQGRAREALELVDGIPPGTPEYAEAEKLAARIRVQSGGASDTSALERQVERNPSDLESRYALGLARAAAGQYGEALEQFIQVVAEGRDGKRDAARKSILDIFQILGSEHPLTLQFRGRLASLLYS